MEEQARKKVGTELTLFIDPAKPTSFYCLEEEKGYFQQRLAYLIAALLVIAVLIMIGVMWLTILLQRLPQRNLRQAVSLKEIGAGGKEEERMKFAEAHAWLRNVCAITYPLYALFFVLAHFYKKKTQRGSGCTVFLKATVIEPLRIRIKHSYHYFMIYQYEYMGYVYQKNTGIDLAYHQAQKKIGTEVEIYIDPSDPEKYFCPADVKM